MSGRIQAVTMPKWGIEMTEGTINRWNVEEGEAVEKGAPLLDVETEKIVNTVDSPASGTLRRIVAGAGDLRPVGALLAVLAAPEVSEAELERFITDFRGAQVSFEPEASSPAASGAAFMADSPAAAPPPEEEEARISPIARRLAESLGIDITTVRGTGRNGRVTREDVAGHAARITAGKSSAAGEDSAAGAAHANEPVRKRLSATRATIARRLLESKQTIPHYRLSI
ncbi:MAG: E3 binding domain-containing protein, partial [Gammaproteobacteria bacterium]|nr:E3 binding domain-containing protein [Gammaproteobacteria bacterium]